MSLSIYTNINSLTAQNNLTKSQSALAQATQRLSSGLQINSASDNAAGYAISTNFTTQIGGLGQASSNASDAINLAQTTQSALSQVTANLQAIRDLAVQSANGSYSASDRASINAEVQQRLSEITRIGNQTQFNGQSVLNGTLGTQTFQVGANVGQTVGVNLSTDVRASALGKLAEIDTGAITLPPGAVAGTAITTPTTDFSTTAASFTVDGHAVTLNQNYGTVAAVATAIQGQLNSTAPNAYTVSGTPGTGLTITSAAGTAAPVLGGSSTSIAAVFGTAQTSTDLSTTDALSVNGTVINLKGAVGVQGIADAVNAAGISGVSAAVNSAGNGVNFYSNSSLNITDGGTAIIGANATNAATNLAYTTGAVSASGDLAGGNVLTVDSSNALISRIDVALNTVSNLNSTLGAIQNRFQSAISTISSQSNDIALSQSTIRDTNFAAETANLSKANILQQAGIAVLAQANSQPQQVLKLLQ